MTRHRVRAWDYVEHMREACDKVSRYISGKSYTDFCADSLLHDAVIRNLEVLGEACGQLLQVLPEVEDRFPAVPFRTIYSTRNRLIHGYHTLDLAPIWSIAEREIPTLSATLRAILSAWPADL